MRKIAFKVVQMKFLAMHITNQKKFWYIYSRKFSKYLHGTSSLLNILMIFGIKEKWIILSHTMYCWLLLQIHLCYLWLLLCSRVTNYFWSWPLTARRVCMGYSVLTGPSPSEPSHQLPVGTDRPCSPPKHTIKAQDAFVSYFLF